MRKTQVLGDTKDMTTCTVIVSATGRRCGAEAVHTFKSTISADTFAECAAHRQHVDTVTDSATRIGERVEVRRYGKTYTATVVKVGARGAVWAEFTYGNGAKRTVRI